MTHNDMKANVRIPAMLTRWLRDSTLKLLSWPLSQSEQLLTWQLQCPKKSMVQSAWQTHMCGTVTGLSQCQMQCQSNDSTFYHMLHQFTTSSIVSIHFLASYLASCVCRCLQCLLAGIHRPTSGCLWRVDATNTALLQQLEGVAPVAVTRQRAWNPMCEVMVKLNTRISDDDDDDDDDIYTYNIYIVYIYILVFFLFVCLLPTNS